MRWIPFFLVLSLTTPVWSDSSRNFDGIDDNLQLSDIAAIDSATSLSCSAWTFHNSLANDDELIAKNNSTTDGFLFFRDDVGAVSGRTEIYTIFIAESSGTGTARVEGATNSSPLSTWTYIAFTFVEDNSSGLRLYVNGTEDANSPVTTSGILGLDAGTNTVNIASASGGLTPFINGIISHASCYVGKVLTSSEVNELRFKPEAIRDSVTFHLPIFASNSPEIDLSGNGNTGTVTGTTASTNAPPVMMGDAPL